MPTPGYVSSSCTMAAPSQRKCVAVARPLPSVGVPASRQGCPGKFCNPILVAPAKAGAQTLGKCRAYGQIALCAIWQEATPLRCGHVAGEMGPRLRGDDIVFRGILPLLHPALCRRGHPGAVATLRAARRASPPPRASLRRASPAAGRYGGRVRDRRHRRW